jgi:hypothetical protein
VTPERLLNARRILRLGLVAAGLPAAANGLWAALVPSSWYEHALGGVFVRVAPLGPYNEHLVRDLGMALIPPALLLLWAGIVPDRRLVEVAIVASLAFAAPHFTYHLGTAEKFLDVGMMLLLLTALAPLLLLLVLWAVPAALPRTVRARGST